MSLSLIGAGFGRTGTLSLKMALEMLDLGRCYHMMEVFQNPSHAKQWLAAADGRPVDWAQLFADYGATVDWPACTFWRELVDYYPDAKVLLSVRDPERWYKSMSATIFRLLQQTLPDDMDADMRSRVEMVARIVRQMTFDGRLDDKDHAISIFEEHNAAVREAVPADRLLVYEVGDGWEPLCRFLEVPAPAEDFPRVNSTDEFRDRFEMASKS
jgi:hypothetical protein